MNGKDGVRSNYLTTRNLNFAKVVSKDKSLPRIESDAYSGNTAGNWSRDLRRSQDRTTRRRIARSFELEKASAFEPQSISAMAMRHSRRKSFTDLNSSVAAQQQPP